MLQPASPVCRDVDDYRSHRPEWSLRRHLWLTIVFAALSAAPASAHERPTTTPAARFLQDQVDRALTLAKPPVSGRASDELDLLIRDAIDWPTLTRHAIGHYGAKLDAGGLSEVGAQLERQLGQLARRAGKELPTLTIAMRGLRIDPEGNRHILSTADVPRFGEIEVEWTLRPTATGYRVSDISALGLSLRQFLRGWITGLVAAQGGDPTAVFSGDPGASPQ